jgi:hypothetical protein
MTATQADPKLAAPRINAIAIAPVDPSQLMSLIGSSSITLPVHESTQEPPVTNETLVFDEVTGAFVPAANSAATAKTSLFDSLGAEWLIVAPSPATRPATSAARNANRR